MFGGDGLITTFMSLNLVDELMTSVHSLILGKGKHLFIDIQNRTRLELIDTKTFSTGLVQLFYKIES
ncbi:MAG: dihydrofolate reductase family protein [Cellulophaga sp.]